MGPIEDGDLMLVNYPATAVGRGGGSQARALVRKGGALGKHKDKPALAPPSQASRARREVPLGVQRAPTPLEQPMQHAPVNPIGMCGPSTLSIGVRAVPACLLGDMPAVLGRTLSYTAGKRMLLVASASTGSGVSGVGVLSVTEEIALAVVVACVIAVITTPLDVMRTRALALLVEESSCATLASKEDAPAALGRDQAEGTTSHQHNGGGGTMILRAAAELRDAGRESRGAAYFAGTVPRILWNGICVGATTPLRSLGYYWVRDGVILQLFDSAASSAKLS